MTEESDDPFEIRIDPPDLVVDLELAEGFEATFEYPLDEILEIDADEDVEIISSDETGVVLEVDGETEHIDLRELGDVKEEVGD